MGTGPSRKAIEIPVEDYERLEGIAQLHDIPTSMAGILLLRAAMASRSIDSMLASADKTGLTIKRRPRAEARQWESSGAGMWVSGPWVLMKEENFLRATSDKGIDSWWWLHHEEDAGIRRPMAFTKNEAIRRADAEIGRLTSLEIEDAG